MTKLYKGGKYAEVSGGRRSGDLPRTLGFFHFEDRAPYRAIYMFIDSVSNKLDGRPRVCCMWVLTPCLNLDIGHLLNSFYCLSSLCRPYSK